MSKGRLYTMIDLFAGCGGLSLGFEQSGFTPVFVNEINRDALSTYLLNRHHELGGMKFSENSALHSYDAHEIQGERLEQLISDLSSLNDVDLCFEKAISKRSAAGSTLDVIAGGPPCQGYSGIGIRRSYAVDRKVVPSNVLYRRMAQVVGRLRPRLVLFENVRGLLNAKWTRRGKTRIWSDVKKEFRSLSGYEFRWSLVFAKDYGVPQNRPRILMVGVRNDVLESCKFLEPTNDSEDAIKCGFLPRGESGRFPNLSELLGDLVDPSIVETLRTGKYPSGRFQTTAYPSCPQNSMQAALRTAPSWDADMEVELSDHEYSKHRAPVVKKFDHMLENHGEIPQQYKTRKFSQRVLRPSWGNSEPNITATCLPDDYVHYCQPRILTVREWARLQLFPDWYEFAGKRTTGGLRRAGNPRVGLFDREVPKYTQIGNAVPVSLAEKIGLHFRSILSSYSRDD